MSDSIQKRFMAFVRPLPDGPWDGCWEWTGARNEDSYGKFHVNTDIGTLLAHRWSYMAHHKVVLEEEDVIDHLCRNHWCVRPSHLEAVSLKVNTARGQSITAKNTRKDACSRGHAFTPENTYKPPRGGRACRACMRMANQNYSFRRPEKARERVRRYRSG